MLSPYRVLDLTNERGLLCGQILADLGADVIAVEPPAGNSARRLGPFAGDEPDPERSLYWWAYSRNKRSVTLDIESDEGRDKLRGLVEGADNYADILHWPSWSSEFPPSPVEKDPSGSGP